MFFCQSAEVSSQSNSAYLDINSKIMKESSLNSSNDEIMELTNRISLMEKSYREMEKMYVDKLKSLSCKLSEKDQQFKKLITQLFELKKFSMEHKIKVEELNKLSEKNTSSETRLKSRSPNIKNTNKLNQSQHAKTEKSLKSDQFDKDRRSPKNQRNKMSPFHQNTVKKTPIFKKSTAEASYSSNQTHRSSERIVKKSLSPKRLGQPKVQKKEGDKVGFITDKSKPLASLREKDSYEK